jgi:branched-chain amino acid transport system substrate-binding protein
VAITWLAAGCGVVTGWSEQPPPAVLIGVDLNLTGRGGAPGTVFHNALRLQQDLLAERDLPGRRLTLRVLDNRGDAGTSAENLAELAADPAVAAIITAGCPPCVIEAAAQLSVPVISLDAVEAVAAPAAERRWVFRLGPNAGDDADVLSAAIAQTGAVSVGLVTAEGEYGQEGLAWMRDAAGRDGLNLVIHQRVDPADEDGVAGAAKAIADWIPDPAQGGPDPAAPAGDQPQTGPDAVTIWTDASQAAQLATALREAGYTGPLFVDMIGAEELFLTAESAAFTNGGSTSLVFTATPAADQRIAASPALAARQSWVLAYTSRYGTYHLHASWAADALLVVVDAVDRAGGAERERLRDRIESARIDGLTGQIRFTAAQHSGLNPNALVMLTATGDRWQ